MILKICFYGFFEKGTREANQELMNGMYHMPQPEKEKFQIIQNNEGEEGGENEDSVETKPYNPFEALELDQTFNEQLEYNEQAIPIGLMIDNIMKNKEENINLFHYPYMNLSRFYLKSMVWKIVSRDKIKQPKKSRGKKQKTTTKTQKFGRFTFDFHLTCAHCCEDVIKFSDDRITEYADEKFCENITRAFKMFFR